MLAKSFYYNFILTKAEEEACKAMNTPFKLTRTLTEIRDVYPSPVIDPLNPWVIKQVLTPFEAGAGKLIVPCFDMCNHIFRYWTLEMANHLVHESKQNVVVWDATDESNPTSYIDMFLEAGPECNYFLLGFMDLIRDRRLISGDEIGLFWQMKTASFQFKAFNRGV